MCGGSFGKHICATCGISGGCLAGRLDDDWVPAAMDEVICRLDNHRYNKHRVEMKKYLIREYLYDYDRRAYIVVDDR